MAINLLPQKEKKRIKKIYKIRRLKATSWLVITLVVISIIMLFPLFLLSKNTKILALDKQDHLARESEGVQVNEVREMVFLINKKTRVLNDSEHTKVYDIFSDISENKISGISITGLAFNVKESEEVDIVGNARDRETLLSFRRDLEQKIYVESVNLPVSNFAQNVDIDFSIKITLKNDE